MAVLGQLILETIKKREHIFVEDDMVVIADTRYPRSSIVSLNPDDNDTLESIWFLLRTHDFRLGQYVREAARNRIPNITFTRRKSLLEQLLGLHPSLPVGMFDPPRKVNLPAAPEESAGKVDEMGRTLIMKGRDAVRGMVEDILQHRIDPMKSKNLFPEDSTAIPFLQFDGGRTKELRENEIHLSDVNSVLSKGTKPGAFSRVVKLSQEVKQYQDARRRKRGREESIEVERARSLRERQHIKQKGVQWASHLGNKEAQQLTEIDEHGSMSDIYRRKAGAPPEIPPVDTMKVERKPPGKSRDREDKNHGRDITRIIIVPSAPSAAITMYNAYSFLHDCRFVSSEECRRRNPQKQRVVAFERRLGNTVINYEVRDNAKGLSRNDWDRVVAVFAQGPSWQFKEWPFDSPAVLFDKIQGFHLKYEDVEPHSNIKQWRSVKVLVISRLEAKRYLDGSVVYEFWRILEQFIERRRPELVTRGN